MASTTIKELQDKMPWTKDLWSPEYLQDPRDHKNFTHCLTNIAAKLGSLFQASEMADHYGHDYPLGPNKERDAVALAIIIMSALKAANVHPDGPIDIEHYIELDLERRRRGNNEYGRRNSQGNK